VDVSNKFKNDAYSASLLALCKAHVDILFQACENLKLSILNYSIL
jgi:hypothetical protein